MALKLLPGGVIVETDGGARLNEDAGVNLEAIHRQLASAGAVEAAAEADRAEAAAARLVHSLPGFADLDTLTEPRWWQTAGGGSGWAGLHYPVNVPGELRVVPIGGWTGAAMQVYLVSDGRLFTRETRDGGTTWTPWASPRADALVRSVPAGQDVGTLPMDTAWTVPSTRPGVPAGFTVGLIETFTTSAQTAMQRATDWGGRIWTRSASAPGVWGGWVDILASAVRVQVRAGGSSMDDLPVGTLTLFTAAPAAAPVGVIVCQVLTTAFNAAGTNMQQVLTTDTGRVLTRRKRSGIWDTMWTEATRRIGHGSKVVPLAVTLPGSATSTTQAAGTVRWVRSWAHAPRRVRVHVSNSNAGNSVSGSGATMTGLTVAVGQADGSVTGVVQSIVTGAIPGAGQSLASEWLEVPGLEDGGRLAVTVSWSGASQVMTAQGGGWTTTATDPAAPSVAGWTRAQTTPFHVWVEAEVPARAPVILAHGDSITLGTATTDPVEDSWAAQYARQVGAVSVILAQHGSTMTSWRVGDPRWAMFDGFDLGPVVDAVVTTLGQNDLVAGVDLATLQTRHGQVMAAIRALCPSAPVFLGEITPSNKAAEIEQVRRDFNAWRETQPHQERGVTRWASVVGGGTDEDLAAQYSADGLHPNAAGQAAMAEVARSARVVPLTLTDAQMEALTA